MHRNRVWSFTSPVFRLNRNRILDVDGYVPALDLLVWDPTDFGSFEVLITLNESLANPFTVKNNLAPIQFKWDIVSGTVPRGTTLRWKKNNGSFNTWTRNTNTVNTTFTEGDTLTVAITTGDTTGSFTFALYNSLDNRICSTPYSVSVIPS